MNEEKTIPSAQYDETEELVEEYIEQFGAEPSFFEKQLSGYDHSGYRPRVNK